MASYKFTDDFLDLLKEQADIVGIIGEHVKLKRTGGSWRGPCPFHQGKGPNFSVDPAKGFYHCFKCQVSGTAVTFLQKHVGMDWASAVEAVANRSGIALPVRQDRQGPDPRERFWEVNAAAAAYFTRMLWEDDKAAPAREYLKKRQISREVADRFQLGFAPYETGLLRTHMDTLGFDEARLLEGGLLVKREELAEPRPRFRRRLMFPILDAQGHGAGFGGRALGDEEPKYLNSPEGPAFAKRRLLYGLNSAKNHIRKDARVLVVEGYFDAIRLMAAGIETAVAPLGTALTDEQVALLVRYTKNVFLLYDSDEAGQKATFRSGLELLRAGASVRIVSLPSGEDPDSFVQAQGGDALLALLADAIDLFERQLQLLERGGWFGDLHRKRQAIDKLLPTIRATADPLTRDIYVQRLSELAHVDRELLLREAAAEPPRSRSAETAGAGQAHDRDDDDRGPSDDGEPPAWEDVPPVEAVAIPRPSVPAKRGRWGKPRGPEWVSVDSPLRRGKAGVVGFERELARLMVAHRGFVDRVAREYGPDAFRDDEAASIFHALVDHGADATIEALASDLPPQAVTLLEQLNGESGAIADPEHAFQRAIVRFRIREIEESNRQLSELVEIAAPAEKDELMRQKHQNSLELRNLKNAGWAAYLKSRT